MTLPTPDQERKVVALFFLWIALGVIGALSVLIGGAYALAGIFRLIAGWVFE